MLCRAVHAASQSYSTFAHDEVDICTLCLRLEDTQGGREGRSDEAESFSLGNVVVGKGYAQRMVPVQFGHASAELYPPNLSLKCAYRRC